MTIDTLVAAALCNLAQLITGARAIWDGCPPDPRSRIYFANHSSHGDFVLIWASLPPALRAITRPVAGADYWLTSGLRRFIAQRVFRGVLIDRTPARQGPNPIEQMGAALAAGSSLILFPEGTRNTGDDLLPFKSGLFHLAKAHPKTELVPVWIENLGRAMPKGTFIPAPLLCTLTFGTPLHLVEGEGKEAFLTRARDALQAAAPQHS